MAQDHSASTIPEDRPLSDEEHSLVSWLLEHGESHAPPFLSQLAEARVVGRCGCGCASVDFAVGGKPPSEEHGMDILSDYLWDDAEGHKFGAFVFARGGLLAGLDVWSVDGAMTPTALPKTDQLTPLAPATRQI